MFSFAKKTFTSRQGVVILNGKRTAIGSFMGKLSTVQAPLLGSACIDGALQASKVNKEEVQEVIMGNVLSAGLGQAPARQAAIKAGLKPSTICTTVNKVCSSGLKAITLGAQSIMLEDSEIVVAGGFENMSLVPHYSYLRKAFTYGNPMSYDGILLDGLSNSFDGKTMGLCAEKTNKDLKIGRAENDEYCIQSYERTLNCMKKGLFQKEIVSISFEAKKGVKENFNEDEEPTKFLKEKIPNLKPVFEKDGTITAANSSKINDGGAAVVLMNEKLAKDRGLRAVARIIGYADAELEPVDFSIAPSSAVTKLLKKCNMSIKDIDYFEFNEAFASVAIANMKLLGLNSSKVNLHGGAVAMGHPVGMSGARLVLSLINVLQEINGRYGVVAICNGGGGASSILIERL